MILLLVSIVVLAPSLAEACDVPPLAAQVGDDCTVHVDPSHQPLPVYFVGDSCPV